MKTKREKLLRLRWRQFRNAKGGYLAFGRATLGLVEDYRGTHGLTQPPVRGFVDVMGTGPRGSGERIEVYRGDSPVAAKEAVIARVMASILIASAEFTLSGTRVKATRERRRR